MPPGSSKDFFLVSGGVLSWMPRGRVFLLNRLEHVGLLYSHLTLVNFDFFLGGSGAASFIDPSQDSLLLVHFTPCLAPWCPVNKCVHLRSQCTGIIGCTSLSGASL